MMGYQHLTLTVLLMKAQCLLIGIRNNLVLAGRAAFILGQHPFRTGLLTIGMPGASQGVQDNQPTIAELLKNQGYTSGQFG